MNNNINDLIAKILEESNTKSINIVVAKKLFFDCLKVKNVSEDTIKYYKNIFYRIDDFFLKNHIDETKQINDTLLIALINDSLEENLSANYINKLVSCIKYLVNTLAKFNYINDVNFNIGKLKEQEHRINNISKEKLMIILEGIKSMDLKTQLIVLLLLATGVRRSELVRIQLNNIDLEENCIILEKTKTNVVRTCFFTDEINVLITQYLQVYKPVTYLFEGKIPGIALKARSVSKILEKIKVCLDLDELSAHQFRHTFATCIYESSDDIELTRQLMGHASYTMTKRYLHSSKDKLKKKYLKYNPFITHN